MARGQTKRKERKDIVVCGANGFTGNKLLEMVVKQRPHLKVGATCRTEEKANEVLKLLSNLKQKTPPQLTMHVVDATDTEKLAKIFQEYKVVINCIGPFIYTGLPVVSAAVKAGTDYVDCTGEPGFIEKSMDMFKHDAEKENVLVVHACGFDSLPVDIGMMYTVQEVNKRGETGPLHAESYLEVFNANINIGTFKTAVASIDELKSRKTAKKGRNKTKEKPRKIRKFPFFSKDLGKYCVMFPGSDSYVLRRTREFLNGAHPLCHCYFAVPTALSLVFLLFFMVLLFVTHISPGFIRSFIYSHIDAITMGKVRKNGPTKKEIESSRFEMKIVVKGSNTENKHFKLTGVVSGPDPGYVTTPIALLTSAETILHNRGDALKNRKGVLTPAAAFHDTDIITRLTDEKIIFRVEKE